MGGLINGSRGAYYPGGPISGIKKMFRNDEIGNESKLKYYYILSYIYNTFIVCHNKRRNYFRNIYKTDLCDCF